MIVMQSTTLPQSGWCTTSQMPQRQTHTSFSYLLHSLIPGLRCSSQGSLGIRVTQASLGLETAVFSLHHAWLTSYAGWVCNVTSKRWWRTSSEGVGGMTFLLTPCGTLWPNLPMAAWSCYGIHTSWWDPLFFQAPESYIKRLGRGLASFPFSLTPPVRVAISAIRAELSWATKSVASPISSQGSSTFQPWFLNFILEIRHGHGTLSHF